MQIDLSVYLFVCYLLVDAVSRLDSSAFINNMFNELEKNLSYNLYLGR